MNKTYFLNRGIPLSCLKAAAMMTLFSLCILAAAPFFCVPKCQADWNPHVKGTLEQIYDSNIFLDPEGVKGRKSRSDFRTNFGAILGITNKTQYRSLDIEYAPTYSLFVKNGGESYLRHTAMLDLEQDIAEHLLFYAYEHFDYNQEPISLNQESTAVNFGRRKNINNESETGLTYQFGPEDNAKIFYYDNRLIYLNDSNRRYGHYGYTRGNDDSVEYGPGIEINYWLNVRNGLSLSYQWQRVDYEIQPSRRVDHVDAAYLYRWDPKTLARIDYIFDNVRSYGHLSPDYKIHQAQAGFERSLSPSLSLTIMAGFYHRSLSDEGFIAPNGIKFDHGSSKNDGFMGHTEVLYNREHWNVKFTADSGVRLEFNDYNNRGYTPYRSFGINANYDFTDRLHGFVIMAYTYESSPDTVQAIIKKDHRVETYHASCGMKYLIKKWLECKLTYAYNDQSETSLRQYPLGYNDHVVMFSVTAVYDWMKHETKNQEL